MNAVLSLSCGKTLTRASLIGEQYRIAKVYGNSPLALRIYRAYARTLGENSAFLDACIVRCMERRLRPFDSIQPYKAREFTYRQRHEAELFARWNRGEKFDALTRRQAY